MGRRGLKAGAESSCVRGHMWPALFLASPTPHYGLKIRTERQGARNVRTPIASQPPLGALALRNEQSPRECPSECPHTQDPKTKPRNLLRGFAGRHIGRRWDQGASSYAGIWVTTFD